ncbi:flagellar hook protein FlgE [Alkalilimnicola ehrlichii]|uniref:Flagellar hook protein FlgE n=1 Tax=Alkalilimnicola ehrlichii TaxID=351052 RepID=A0A3E0X0X1_9GAMM|nr:flagellar hook protein FlgE [Alkalilimnicola ehrlichii]RFA30739.1 flagellar hook protein FlgE [Alkalilimnicola ehrlichii]RFA38315.1 flagellar hook protein FlgE [Alkalilimnicola ehrlichii]
MSFDISLTGLNAINSQLNTISQNVANTGTVGFKSSRTDFASVYADSQPMGVEVAGITQSISLGGPLNPTGRDLDLAISGGGFFVTRAANGDVTYTRAGVFNTNRDDYIINNHGHRLQGYPVNANGDLMTGAVGDLRLQTGNLPAEATESVDFVMNLNADDEIPAVAFDPDNAESYNSTYTTEVYDSLGRAHALTQYFVKTDDANNEWQVHYFIDGTALGTHDVEFDGFGNLVAGAGSNINYAPGAGANALDIDLNYTGSTQTGSPFVVTTNRADGHPPGERTGLEIAEDGQVFATFSNGERLLQGQVILANFANPEGLRNISGTAWRETAESGTALLGTPGTGQYGGINSGMLESSNVDLTQQLVGLMEGQRNYQANSRVISTQNELTQILFSAL